MSTLRVTTLATQAGVEVYTAKAWVNFNGTGTVAIRASGNVSSITDNGTGDYTVNFTVAMADADYSVVANCKKDETGSSWRIATPQYANTSSSCRWKCILSTNGTSEDMTSVYVAAFR